MLAATLPRYGAPDALTVRDVPRPALGPTDMAIAVHASPVTQGDRRFRASDFPGFTWILARLALGVWRPRNPVVGTIYSGTVLEVGSSVTRVAVGDEVFGCADHGAHAEVLHVKEDSAWARLPSGVSHEEAAAVPFGAHTALGFLHRVAKLETGQRIAIVGAAGEVGRSAVQLAVARGAEVTGVCRSRSASLVRQLGAHHIVDFTEEDFTARGEVYDVIFDTAGATSLGHCRRALARDGMFLSLELTFGLLAQMAWTMIAGGRQVRVGVSLPTAADMDEIARLMESAQVRATIRERFALASVEEAHRVLEARQGDGTILLLPRPPTLGVMATALR